MKRKVPLVGALQERIQPVQERANGLQTPALVAVAHMEKAGVDEIDGVLLEFQANVAGRLKGQGSGKARLGMPCDGGVAGQAAQQAIRAVQLRPEGSVGSFILRICPCLPGRGAGRDDGKRAGKRGGEVFRYESSLVVEGWHWIGREWAKHSSPKEAVVSTFWFTTNPMEHPSHTFGSVWPV